MFICRTSLGKALIICGLISTLVLSGCQGTATVTPVPGAPSTPTELPTATLTPTETATTTPTNTASPTATAKPTVVISDKDPFTLGMPVLYAKGGDLWCSSLDGENTLQLTQDDALNLVAPPPAGSSVDIVLSSQCGPNVSPDGRWIAYYPYSEWGATVILLPTVDGMTAQTVDNTCYGVWSPDSTRLAYAPNLASPWNKDLTPVFYIYDVQTQSATPYYPPEENDENTWNYASDILWAPDGQSVVFRGTVESEKVDESGIHYSMCNVIKLDLQTGASTVIGEVRTSVASNQIFCLDSEGNFATDADSGVTCSKDYSYFTSPNGLWTYSYRKSTENEGATTISVVDADENVLWERDLEFSPGKIRWSSDGAYLLIDDYDMTTPIWRLASDGSGELEQVVDEGYLLDVVADWVE